MLAALRIEEMFEEVKVGAQPSHEGVVKRYEDEEVDDELCEVSHVI